jgi:hypothetical protein
MVITMATGIILIIATRIDIMDKEAVWPGEHHTLPEVPEV